MPCRRRFGRRFCRAASPAVGERCHSICVGATVRHTFAAGVGKEYDLSSYFASLFYQVFPSFGTSAQSRGINQSLIRYMPSTLVSPTGSTILIASTLDILDSFSRPHLVNDGAAEENTSGAFTFWGFEPSTLSCPAIRCNSQTIRTWRQRR